MRCIFGKGIEIISSLRYYACVHMRICVCVHTYELDIRELKYDINILDSVVHNVIIQPKTAHMRVENSSILDRSRAGILSKSPPL